LWNKGEAFFEGDPEKHRPDKLILCYPVMRGGENGNHGSLQNLYGDKEVPADFLEKFNLPPKVDAGTPPAFLWATAADRAVPASCSLDFASALAKQGIPYELHIWRDGDHGLCLGDHVTQAMPYGNPLPVAEWIDLATKFMYT
jgi:acetyl esterase/lipase